MQNQRHFFVICLILVIVHTWNKNRIEKNFKSIAVFTIRLNNNNNNNESTKAIISTEDRIYQNI